MKKKLLALLMSAITACTLSVGAFAAVPPAATEQAPQATTTMVPFDEIVSVDQHASDSHTLRNNLVCPSCHSVNYYYTEYHVTGYYYNNTYFITGSYTEYNCCRCHTTMKTEYH